MLINYIIKSAIPITTPVQTADPVLEQVPFFFASLSQEDKAKWFIEEERHHKDRRLDEEHHCKQRELAQAARDIELAKLREERQAAADSAAAVAAAE